jgi:uncharacterized protein involved in type VI secretion and phage assembly
MNITEILKQDSRSGPKIYGAVVGTVIKNNSKSGCVKVKIPRIFGEGESNWARVVSFMAGNDRGAFYLPEKDDEVLVVFEDGDIAIPYVLGSLWNGKDKLPLKNDDGKNNLKVIKSRSGHIILLNDTDGKEKIEIVDKTGKNTFVIDSKENKISIKSDKDIEISAPNGTVRIQAKNIEAISNGSAKIEGSKDTYILVENKTMTIKGKPVNIN